ncbi:hypothetical protein [uncultured Psychrobacter sp.]|uniref:hypothetical protein n=1 Tax=uncultured Psychrobacter sp. TaxID=259303 RepID=UPI0034594EAB
MLELIAPFACICTSERGGHYWLMVFLLSETTLSQVPATRSDAQDTTAVTAKKPSLIQV